MVTLIDTNILVSAAYFPHGKAALAYRKAVDFPYRGIVCEQSLTELLRVARNKFPADMMFIQSFIADMLAKVMLVPVPPDEISEEMQIRDSDDRTILRSAIVHKADIILTGDRDFLDAEIEHPQIIAPADFVRIG